MHPRNVIPKTERQAQARLRALHVLARVRNGESLSQASRNEGTKAATVRKYVGRQLRRSGLGKHWKATKSDRLTAYMNVQTQSGLTTVLVRGSRERILLGRYNAALLRWRRGQPGSDAELSTFEGKSVGGLPLITDLKVLTQLEDAEQLDFDQLYAGLATAA